MRRILLALLVLGTVERATADPDVFARCVARTGARYYWARWCPHCAAQAKMFGGAMGYLDAVDCSTEGARACRDANVHAFPTWVFGDGSRLTGVASLSELGHRTGCPLAERREAFGERANAVGGVHTRERKVGGVTIIEVPGR